MAEPIAYQSHYDPREALIRKLREAPEKHSEALLDAYEVLQLMRDKGLLEIAKGALGSGEKVMGILTTTLEADETVTLVRNLVILVKLLGGLNPQMLENLQKSLLTAANDQVSAKSPGVIQTIRKLFSPDSRRFFAVIATICTSLGRSLSANVAKSDPLLGKNRQKITRHNA